MAHEDLSQIGSMRMLTESYIHENLFSSIETLKNMDV